MKYYRHTMTMREELALKRRTDRAQAGFDLLIALFICLSVAFISVMVLS
jgi:Tfp pilus assembly protein PilX